ncbi:MAG TPA: triphosphoribosyl-dephospho-CoA synthase, partial [Lacipirellulaceae bacterium]|nr:triphosphoribosyl-dephospho-CoA synthase [Lacipirellulaceae bacterium]
MNGPRPTCDATPAPPLTPGACAALACLWEVTAPKPGNIYRGADFDDATFADFLTSAAVIAPSIDRVAELGVGRAIYEGVAATRRAVGPCNTNLGILLLLAPLAAVHRDLSLAEGISTALDGLSAADSQHVYAAIRLAAPGGLGRVDDADVSDEAPDAPLRQLMQLAADRDLIAAQYVNNFAEVFATADRLAAHATQSALADAIVRAFLELLRDHPDSLIARKCGLATARQASGAAASLLDAAHDEQTFRALLADFDFWLRSDGH